MRNIICSLFYSTCSYSVLGPGFSYYCNYYNKYRACTQGQDGKIKCYRNIALYESILITVSLVGKYNKSDGIQVSVLNVASVIVSGIHPAAVYLSAN